jgi:hypothetical protein
VVGNFLAGIEDMLGGVVLADELGTACQIEAARKSHQSAAPARAALMNWILHSWESLWPIGVLWMNCRARVRSVVI